MVLLDNYRNNKTQSIVEIKLYFWKRIKIINAILTFLSFNPNQTLEARLGWHNSVPAIVWMISRGLLETLTDECETTPSAPQALSPDFIGWYALLNVLIVFF